MQPVAVITLKSDIKNDGEAFVTIPQNISTGDATKFYLGVQCTENFDSFGWSKGLFKISGAISSSSSSSSDRAEMQEVAESKWQPKNRHVQSDGGKFDFLLVNKKQVRASNSGDDGDDDDSRGDDASADDNSGGKTDDNSGGKTDDNSGGGGTDDDGSNTCPSVKLTYSLPAYAGLASLTVFGFQIAGDDYLNFVLMNPQSTCITI